MTMPLEKSRDISPPDVPFQMRVLSGNQRGASAALPEGAILIGNSLEADVVLTGLDVKPRHATVTLTDVGVELEALEGAISVNGVRKVSGERVTVRYPASIKIGESEIEFQRAEPRLLELALAPKNRVPVIAAGAGGLAVLSLLGGYVLWGGGGHRGLATPERTPAAEEARARQALEARKQLEAASQTAMAGLKARLETDGIRDLDVSSAPGAVAVSGMVDLSYRKAWTEVERWYDETYGKSVALQSNVTFGAKKSATAPIAVQSIWAGKMPYFIDSRGDKYFEGSMLRDGWSVEKIEEGRILLIKNGERLSLVL
jgi:type III secretion protein D